MLFDPKEVVSQRKGSSIVCRAFLGVSQIKYPLLYKGRLVLGLLYDWPDKQLI
jgi:hypothetical protein